MIYDADNAQVTYSILHVHVSTSKSLVGNNLSEPVFVKRWGFPKFIKVFGLHFVLNQLLIIIDHYCV